MEKEFEKVLKWAATQKGGFTWGDLQRHFKFDGQQIQIIQSRLRSNMPASENLVDHIYSSGIDQNLLFLTNKGRSLLITMENKSSVREWYERPIGIVFLGIVVVLIGGYLLFKFGLN